jgi:tetratricopeptide (TPR) repeat protein
MKAKSINCNFPNILLVRMGAIYADIGDQDAAVTVLTKALELAESNAERSDAHLHLAQVLSQVTTPEQYMLSSQNVVFGSDHEIEDLKVEKQKKDAMLLSDDQCLSHLEQAVAMNPNHEMAHYSLLKYHLRHANTFSPTTMVRI